MALTPEQFALVKDLVYRDAGIVLETGKEYLVEARLSTLARQRQLPTIQALLEEFNTTAGSRAKAAVVEAMTTNETSFFRDGKPFEVLKSTVLPALIEKRRDKQSLSIWCAASSTGQEPYTIAMTLREGFPTLANWKISFVATDLSLQTLERARAGRFSQLEVNRGLPAPMLIRYFAKHGLDWEICQPLRQMIDFRQLNLLGAWPKMPAADIVFIRNVLIYFDSPTKKQILGRIRRVMKPDGYLFLGGAETTINLDDAYERLPVDRSGCYRLKSASGVTAATPPIPPAGKFAA